MDACEPPSTDCRANDRRETLAVDVVLRSAAWTDLVSTEEISAAARAAYAASGRARGAAEVSLLLSDDAEIKALNAAWRSKNVATNVLSFPLGQPGNSDGAIHLGDIALARETVMREAGEAGIAVRQHALHLVVHGLLHLLGYDHEAAADAEKMENLEVEILAELGLPNPYLAQLVEGGETT